MSNTLYNAMLYSGTTTANTGEPRYIYLSNTSSSQTSVTLTTVVEGGSAAVIPATADNYRMKDYSVDSNGNITQIRRLSAVKTAPTGTLTQVLPTKLVYEYLTNLLAGRTHNFYPTYEELNISNGTGGVVVYELVTDPTPLRTINSGKLVYPIFLKLDNASYNAMVDNSGSSFTSKYPRQPYFRYKVGANEILVDNINLDSYVFTTPDGSKYLVIESEDQTTDTPLNYSLQVLMDPDGHVEDVTYETSYFSLPYLFLKPTFDPCAGATVETALSVKDAPFSVTVGDNTYSFTGLNDFYSRGLPNESVETLIFQQ